MLSTTDPGKFRIHTPTRSFQSKLVKQVLHLLVENIELSTNLWLQFLFCRIKCSQIVALAKSFGSISVLYMYSEMLIGYKRKVSQLIVIKILTDFYWYFMNSCSESLTQRERLFLLLCHKTSQDINLLFFSLLNSFQVKRKIIEFSWVYQNLGVTLGA